MLKSSFRLVLHLNGVALEDCVKDFHLYKHRQDVLVEREGSIYKPGQLKASAYAAIYLPVQVTGGSEGIACMLAGVPLITNNKPENHSLYKDAALFSETDAKCVAENMMLLYKDEALRNRCIEKGLEIRQDYNLKAVAEKLEKILKLQEN